MGGNT